MRDMAEGYIGLRGEILSRDEASAGNWMAHYVAAFCEESKERKLFIELAPGYNNDEINAAVRKFKPKLQADGELRDYVLPNLERMLRKNERQIGAFCF